MGHHASFWKGRCGKCFGVLGVPDFNDSWCAERTLRDLFARRVAAWRSRTEPDNDVEQHQATI